MSSQNNQTSTQRGRLNAPSSTTQPTSNQDYSFTLQMIMELQRSVGQVSESVAQIHRETGKIESKINKLESSMSSVKTTITVAGIVLTIIIAISGFFVDKVWDSVANHIDISVKK